MCNFCFRNSNVHTMATVQLTLKQGEIANIAECKKPLKLA